MRASCCPRADLHTYSASAALPITASHLRPDPAGDGRADEAGHARALQSRDAQPHGRAAGHHGGTGQLGGRGGDYGGVDCGRRAVVYVRGRPDPGGGLPTGAAGGAAAVWCVCGVWLGWERPF